jgi:uncharacterized membrane protein HdeD (DUF308 family)
VLTLFSQIIGGIFLAAGVLEIGYVIWNRAGFFGKGFLVLVGACMLSVGLWMLTRPVDIASMVPTVMGVIVVSSGIMNLLETVTLARQKSRFGFFSAILALATIGMGALLIFYAFPIATTAVRVAGGIQIYNGISDLIIVLKIRTKVKEIRQEMTAVDAEGAFMGEESTETVHVTVEEPEVPASEMEFTPSPDFMETEDPAPESTEKIDAGDISQE